jgi:hypothetical protein
VLNDVRRVLTVSLPSAMGSHTDWLHSLEPMQVGAAIAGRSACHSDAVKFLDPSPLETLTVPLALEATA